MLRFHPRPSFAELIGLASTGSRAIAAGARRGHDQGSERWQSRWWIHRSGRRGTRRTPAQIRSARAGHCYKRVLRDPQNRRAPICATRRLGVQQSCHVSGLLAVYPITQVSGFMGSASSLSRKNHPNAARCQRVSGSPPILPRKRLTESCASDAIPVMKSGS